MSEPTLETLCYRCNRAVERRNGHKAYQTTFDPQKALETLYNALGTWQAVADQLGSYSPSYWCQVAKGERRVSRRAENALRRYVGLAPRGVTRLWEMSVADLRWYLAHRRRVTYGDGKED
jgi:hypothetical protein